MAKIHNPFSGINKVCAQCINDCKQFENVILINCPKFQSNPTKTPLPYSYRNRPRIKNKGGKDGS